jgi:hypothetical protein
MVHDEEFLLLAVRRPSGSRYSSYWLDDSGRVGARFGGYSRYLEGFRRTDHARVSIILKRHYRYADFGGVQVTLIEMTFIPFARKCDPSKRSRLPNMRETCATRACLVALGVAELQRWQKNRCP